MTTRGVLIIGVAAVLMLAARTAGQTVLPTGSFTPSIQLDKTRFALTDHVFFWLVVDTAPHVLLPYGGQGQVTVTRPDRTTRVDRVSDPPDMMYDIEMDPVTGERHESGGGWRGGWGLGSEPLQVGRYTVVFEYRGISSKPASFVVEDVSILKSIHTEIILPSPLTPTTTSAVTLVVRNQSDQPIEFPKFGADSRLTGGITVTLTDTAWTSGFSVPQSLLLSAEHIAPMMGSPDRLDWKSLGLLPVVRLPPDGVYRLDLPADQVLAARTYAARGYRTGRQDLSFGPGDCQIEVRATMRIFMGTPDGPWADLAPFDVDARASGTVRVGSAWSPDSAVRSPLIH